MSKRAKAASKKTAANRVEIAQDALDSLDSKKFRAAEGCWLGRRKKGNDLWRRSEIVPVASEKDVGKDLQEVLLRVSSCYVCAIGGLFAAAVLAHDNFPVTEEMFDEEASVHNLTSEARSLWEYLERFFKDEQLNLIECAFEGVSGGICTTDLGEDDLQVRLAGLFYEQHPKPKDRFRAIMENIIRNKGEFILTVQ